MYRLQRVGHQIPVCVFNQNFSLRQGYLDHDVRKKGHGGRTDRDDQVEVVLNLVDLFLNQLDQAALLFKRLLVLIVQQHAKGRPRDSEALKDCRHVILLVSQAQRLLRQVIQVLAVTRECPALHIGQDLRPVVRIETSQALFEDIEDLLADAQILLPIDHCARLVDQVEDLLLLFEPFDFAHEVDMFGDHPINDIVIAQAFNDWNSHFA